MEIKKNGEIIKFLRNVKNLTQSELASGVCSIKQLRRIEKGDSNPSIEIFERLLTRMGEDSTKYSYDFINISDQNVYIQATQIESLIFDHKYTEARDKLQALKECEAFSLSNKFYLQISLHWEMIFLTTLDKKDEEALKKGYEAINATIKDFNLDSIANYALIKREYSILNSMALIYFSIGETETGISILMNLKNSLNRDHVSKNLKQFFLPIIYYNLSKHLGLQKRYHEAISVCDEGISVCIDARTFNDYGGLLYNKACEFYYLDNLTEARENFMLSHTIFILADDKQTASFVKENAINKYGISF